MERAIPGSGVRAAAILVVEDEPHSRVGLGALLEEQGYRVQTAADVPEAIRHLRSSRFEGAIIDIRLEFHSGTLKGEPRGNYPIEMRQGPSQVRIAIVVIIHIEPDAQGAA